MFQGGLFYVIGISRRFHSASKLRLLYGAIDLCVNRDIAAGDGAIPNVMVSFSMPLKGTLILS